MVSPAIKNLLFDLGGVIINIEPIRVAQALAGFSSKDLSFIRQEIEEQRVFQNYEIGKWDDTHFRQAINHIIEANLTDAQIDEIWNSMLLDIPPERISLLQSLRKRYTLFLLSNTNAIHIKAVNSILQQSSGIANLEALFSKTYYSHQIKLAKPSVAVYEYILHDSKLLPQETLFIDDNFDNINGAKLSGMHTVHIQTPITITDIFTDAPKHD